MKPTSGLSSFITALRAGVLSVMVLGALNVGSRALDLGANLGLTATVIPVKGSATTTITNLVFDPVLGVLISIDSIQSGHLSNIGNFTGVFAYQALATPATITITGNGTLTTAGGDKLFATATILELGTDYPRTLNGTLTITGGTGKYAGAKGVLAVSGIDEESLTDTIDIEGTITVAKLSLGLLK